MNCTEFLAKLTDYFDGQLDPELLEEVKEHLGTCHHCEVIVDTTRMTIDVYRSHEPYDFPEELSTRLCSAVMERCRGSLADADAAAASSTAEAVSASAAPAPARR